MFKVLRLNKVGWQLPGLSRNQDICNTIICFYLLILLRLETVLSFFYAKTQKVQEGKSNL